MSRKLLVVSILLTTTFTATALACLWDTDTLQMERLRFPGVLEIITGKFVRHSKAYYKWRIVDRKQKLASKSNDPALIDDLAVAYAKLGRPEEGIPLLEQVLANHPNRYETLSNLGTLFFFAGRLDESKQHIRRALEINPDAHFGRERYQLLLTEYLQQSDREKLGVMSTESREPQEIGSNPIGFAQFLARNDSHGDFRKATKGVLGMMHFADFQSPVLLEALGDLLLNGRTEQDAARHACRAYLRASEFSIDKTAAERFREMAKQSLAMHLPEKILVREIERDLQGEVEDAKTWFAEIELNERHWIAENRDVDLEFAAKYYDSLESTIATAQEELKPQRERSQGPALPEGPSIPTAVIPLENTWAAPLAGIALAIALLALVCFIRFRPRDAPHGSPG